MTIGIRRHDWELLGSPTIDLVRVMGAMGPWPTKSGGELSVTLALNQSETEHGFLKFGSSAYKCMSPDIRGLRMYTVRGLPVGEIGGTEFHRYREEMIFGLKGSVRWTCEDVYGKALETVINPGNGVWMPPFILHAYEALEEDSGLLVLCNTLFDAGNPETFDTFSTDQFRSLQDEIRSTE